MNLVTGGTGIVGSQLILDLLTKGESVTALKRSNSNLNPIRELFRWEKKFELFDKIKWIDGDITEIGSLNEAMKGINKVFHCAALVSFDPRDRKLLEKVNIEGTANVVNAAISENIEQLVYVSSTAAIGKQKKGLTIDEECNWDAGNGNSSYSYSKYFAELEVWRGAEEGLNTAIVNPAVIIGPGEWGKSSTNVFKTVEKGLKFYSKGSNAFVDVRDVTGVMLALSEKQIFNSRFLLVGENLSFKSFFSTIANTLGKPAPGLEATSWMGGIAWRLNWIWAKITGSRPLITRDTARSAVDKQVYSNEKVKRQLNWEFISVEDAVTRTGEMFRSQNS